ncbi:MAG: 23S rRNA (guanine745-N1)-methyltransferase [Halopseudomonas sp.]|jgi:23S rRNA (guanine745-N1)-methyltransferase|uniref:putative RNA methyltransferase n=1 Tax=Halopseudomonas sp. TaxID=2901191 RepID=UPI0039E45097
MLELICPLCHKSLQPDAHHWGCINNHGYDRARQGYLNLHLVQHKKSRQPGDTPTMLACRQAFLNAGHYQPVSDRIGELLGTAQPAALLDMGCGEGYYTAQLKQALVNCAIGGLDISKDAIIKACRRTRDIQWLVGSTARLPVPNASLDSALCVFSPWTWEECLRCLKPGGQLLLVGPHPDHLMSLREQLYESIHPTPELIKALPEGLNIVNDQTLRYALDLTPADLANLIGMTPHGFRSSPERQRAVIETGLTGLEVAMRLVLLQRC